MGNGGTALAANNLLLSFCIRFSAAAGGRALVAARHFTSIAFSDSTDRCRSSRPFWVYSQVSLIKGTPLHHLSSWNIL